MHGTIMVGISKLFLVTSNLLKFGLCTQSERHAVVTLANSQITVKSGNKSDSYEMIGQLTADPQSPANIR